jgi:hypothetical protein
MTRSWLLSLKVFSVTPGRYEPSSSVSIVTRLWAGQTNDQYPAGASSFCLATTSRPALGPSQPPVQW